MTTIREAAPVLHEAGRRSASPPPVVAVAPPRPSRSDSVAAALFPTLILIGVLPIWLVAHVPTQDGGNHVESVMALLRLGHSAFLQRYYDPNYGLQPNWLTQILFAGLVQIMSPRIAEKVILTGYLVLLPLTFRAALPRTPRRRWAALVIFPFLHSYPFHMGFWNFSYSLALFFVAVGLWYRTRGRLDRRRGTGFAAIMVLLFFAHSVSAALALVAIASILAWRGALALHRAGDRAARRLRVLHGFFRRSLATGACALPSIVLLLVFIARQRKPRSARPSLADYVKHFVGLYPLVSFDRRELLIAGSVSVALVAAVALTLWQRTTRRLRPVDGWLAASVVATGVYFLLPDSVADGGQLTDRLGLYPFLAAAVWLGFAAVPKVRLRALALALSVLFLAGVGLRTLAYRKLDAYLADYESVARHVAERSTVLPLTFAPFGPRRGGFVEGKKLLSYRIEVFKHVNGYVVTERHAVDLDNSQASTLHAPLRWKDEENPFTWLNARPFGLEREPPCVELWRYGAVGGRIDYVILWGATPAAAHDECGSAVLAELASSYRRTYLSPLGMLQLFQPVARRQGPAAATR